jgi:hypothetical protein
VLAIKLKLKVDANIITAKNLKNKNDKFQTYSKNPLKTIFGMIIQKLYFELMLFVSNME